MKWLPALCRHRAAGTYGGSATFKVPPCPLSTHLEPPLPDAALGRCLAGSSRLTSRNPAPAPGAFQHHYSSVRLLTPEAACFLSDTFAVSHCTSPQAATTGRKNTEGPDLCGLQTATTESSPAELCTSCVRLYGLPQRGHCTAATSC